MSKIFELNDVVELKKAHPCGSNEWQVIRMGMDIRIKCKGCGHSVLLPRSQFEKKLKRILHRQTTISYPEEKGSGL